jgi:Domain of unknown function (DUF4214)
MKRTIGGFIAGLALAGGCSAGDEVSPPGTAGEGTGDRPPTRSTPDFALSSVPPDAPNPVNPNFIWGVNGHPTSEDAYSYKSTARHQFGLLVDSLRGKWYRIDVQPDPTGYVAARSSDPKAWNLSQVFDSAAKYQVKILPVLVFAPAAKDDPSPAPCRLDGKYGPCYDLGRLRANRFVARYNNKFTHIEAGNELDDPALGNRDLKGKVASEYAAERIIPVAALIRGMIDGIRAANPSIKILVNSTSTHYGYFDALKNRGVDDFHIYGYHWYEPAGEFDEIYTALTGRSNRDIWIGEFNRKLGSDPGGPANENAQALKILADARKFYGKPRVKAAFVYELFEVTGQVREAYGLVDCRTSTFCTGTLYKKPAFPNYAFAIEEQVHSHEDYVYSLFTHMNRDPHPDSNGLAYWRDRFRQTNSKATLLDAFLPEKSYELFVRDQYLSLLDSGSPPAADVSYWVSQMRSGYLREQVISSLCGTTLFWTLAGSSNGGFVDRLYRKLLDAAPTSSDRDYWVTRLHNGTSTRIQVADALLKSTAYFTRFVNAQWLAILDQNANSTERSYWVGQMQAGMPQIGMIRALLYSVSFWNSAIWAGHRRPPF